MTAQPKKIVLRHYAYREGQDAVENGYTGRNPYIDSPGDAAWHWREGYTAAIAARLDGGQRAVGVSQ